MQTFMLHVERDDTENIKTKRLSFTDCYKFNNRVHNVRLVKCILYTRLKS